jgi:hypothetical protein
VITADSRTDHLAIAARHATPDRWPVAPRFDAADRWYQRIAVAPGYEVWLLTWLPGQGTGLHDHGGSAGAFQVVAGTLTEDVVAGPDDPGGPAGPPVRITARELGEGAGRRFGSRHIHRITNRASRPAISIHVYGPALTSMTRYRVGARGLEVTALERAGVQW